MAGFGNQNFHLILYLHRSMLKPYLYYGMAFTLKNKIYDLNPLNVLISIGANSYQGK